MKFGRFELIIGIFLLILIPFSASASFSRTLAPGSVGTDVQELQQFLKDQGFFPADEKTTTFFGSITEDALSRYQSAVGIEAVGQVGPKTLSLLNSAPVATTTTTLSTLFEQSLFPGTQSPEVAALQQFLKDKGFYTYPEITAYYGPVTEAAVKAFQRANGLEAVGYAGPQTRAKVMAQQSAVPVSTTSTTPIAPSVPTGHGIGGWSGGTVSTNDPLLDTTPPILSSIAVSTTSSTAIITWTTDENSNSVVNYGLTNSYGTSSTTAALSTSHTITLSGLTASTLYYYQIQSTDSSDNISTSGDHTFTTAAAPDITPPIISTIATTTNSTTATITWTTDENSSSAVNYGTSSTYGSASSSPTLSTSHTITLSGLTDSTTYHFQVQSTDASGNTATSTDSTLYTFAPRTYLSSISSSRMAVVSPYRLIQSYSGPLMQLVRSSDNATMNVYPGPDGQTPDIAAINAWAGASTLTVATLYDQSGNGNDFTQPSATNRPKFSTTQGVTRGKYGIITDPATTSTVYKALYNSSISVSRQNFGWQAAIAPMGLGLGDAYMTSFGTDSSTYIRMILSGITSGDNFSLKYNGSSAAVGLPETMPQVFGVRANSSAFEIRRNEQISSKTALSSGNATGGMMLAGASSVVPYSTPTGGNDQTRYADIVYASTPSSTDYETDRSALNQVFDILTGATEQVIFDGDSTTAGIGSTYNQNTTWAIAPLLSQRVYISNLGVPGQLVQAMDGSNGRLDVSKWYRSDLTKNILVVKAGLNDINAQTNGTNANTMATFIYTSYLVPYIQAAQATGYDVVVATLPNRTTWQNDSANTKTAGLAAYNTLIRNGATTYGYTVADEAADSRLSDPSNSTYFYDGVHLTSVGYAISAAIEAAVINTQL